MWLIMLLCLWPILLCDKTIVIPSKCKAFYEHLQWTLLLFSFLLFPFAYLLPYLGRILPLACSIYHPLILPLLRSAFYSISAPSSSLPCIFLSRPPHWLGSIPSNSGKAHSLRDLFVEVLWQSDITPNDLLNSL